MKTLSTKGENCPFRKIVILVKLLLCEITFNTVFKMGSCQNIREINNSLCLNIFLWHENDNIVKENSK